jgi:hypothetical protein
VAQIVSAETVINLPWRDKGQRQVVFRFTLDDGTVHEIGPLYPLPHRDLAEVRALKGEQLLARLAQAEVEELLR